MATRRLHYALAASLVLHLLILWPAGVHVLTKDTPSLLQATLRALPTLPPKPLPPAVPPAPTFSPPAPKLTPPVLERATPVSVPQALAVPAVPVLKPVPAPEPVVSAAPLSAPAGVAESASGSLVTEANASGEAADGLRGYRLAVATQARRFKRYPAQATASGWSGSTEVRVEVAADGRPRAATVARSSGHETLDRAALTMIDAGALRARLPESLRGKAFAVVLPVVFNLDEE